MCIGCSKRREPVVFTLSWIYSAHVSFETVFALADKGSVRPTNAPTATAIVPIRNRRRFTLTSQKQRAGQPARLQNSIALFWNPSSDLAHGRCHSATIFVSRGRRNCQAVDCPY